jgi:CO dehydrogenase/acetyl-CoA synthase epsilon subunit
LRRMWKGVDEKTVYDITVFVGHMPTLLD